MFKPDYGWQNFHIVACSSEEFGTHVELISTQPYATNQSWESSRTAEFPVDIVIRFHSRVELEHIVMSAKNDKNIPEVEFHIGDGLSGSFLDVQYRLAGKAQNVENKLTQIQLHGIGAYLKIRFPKGPKRSKMNPYGQVSIGAFRLWARHTGYHHNIKNNEIPIVDDKSTVDKLLIQLGMPLDLLAWFEEDMRDFDHTPIDEETKQTLDDMQKMKHKFIKVEDYEALKQLKEDLKTVFDLGQQIWKMTNELKVVIAKEDFGRAIELREKLRNLNRKRDTYDALYETSRYENIIVMQRPSTADMMAAQRKLEDEDRERADALRRQRELDEQERRRILEEEKNRMKITEVKKDVDHTPFWEKNKGLELKRKTKKETKKKEKDDGFNSNFMNPFSWNEGDVDLDLYFRPLASSAGELPEVPIEILRRLQHLGYLNVFGARVWTAIHSENWRHREAAAQAVLNFLEMPILDKYLEGKSKKLFLAAMEFAKIVCDDKLLQIYFIGLKILSTALAPPICGKDVSPQIINKALKEFLPILITKISELNFRARDISLHTLISIFQHPAARVGFLVEACTDICDFEDELKSKRNPPVDKQAWRIVLARLEIVLHVLQEFGYDPNEWNWEVVFRYLVTPALFHPNVDVRLIAIEIAVTIYQLLGQEVRIMVNNIENIKPNLLTQINTRMDEVEEIAMQNEQKRKAQAEKGEKEGLSLVQEVEELREKTPAHGQKDHTKDLNVIEEEERSEHESVKDHPQDHDESVVIPPTKVDNAAIKSKPTSAKSQKK